MDSKDILNSDILDIIFEGRNKEYGAYELRKNYRIRARKALIICFATACVLASIPVIASLVNSKKTKKEAPKTKITELIAPPPVDEKKQPPPPPPAPPPPVTPQVKFTPPVIKEAEEEREEEKPPPKKELEKATASTVTVAGDENAKLDAPVIPDKGPAVIEEPKPTAPSKPEIFEFVEQMPEFPGGEEAMMKFIQKNLNYPAQARENNISGRVVVGFVVNEGGEITDVKIIRGLKYGCDEAAMAVVRKMPKWSAGKQNGKAVKVSYSLPITFQLDDE